MRNATGLLMLIGLTAGCAELPTEPFPPEAFTISAAIVDAQGIAAIGFKEAGTPRGVDPQGRVLTNDETVIRMIAYLHTRGVQIQQRFHILPAVVAHMDATPALVAGLLAHPNIDYVEVGLVGSYGSASGAASSFRVSGR
jgi:hypothetical protein